jgi:hypothetical protein
MDKVYKSSDSDSYTPLSYPLDHLLSRPCISNGATALILYYNVVLYALQYSPADILPGRPTNQGRF